MNNLVRLILVGCLVAVCFVVACCAGVIRPPRPMFHDSYGAGGFELLPYWIPNTPLRDSHGQWVWVDKGDNVLVVHATGTPDTGRSHAMTGGHEQARFRLGSAWNDERDNQYITIPRTRHELVVILPDGKWLSFSLGQGHAAQFFRERINKEVPDLLRDAGLLLSREEKGRLDEFLKGYEPPKPPRREG